MTIDWVEVGKDGTGKDWAYVSRNKVTGQVRLLVTAHTLTWDADAAARIGELLQRGAMPGQPIPCGQCQDGLVAIGRCNCGSPADESTGFLHERLCGYEPCPNGCWDKVHPPVTEASAPLSPGAQAREDVRGMWNAAFGHDPF